MPDGIQRAEKVELAGERRQTLCVASRALFCNNPNALISMIAFFHFRESLHSMVCCLGQKRVRDSFIRTSSFQKPRNVPNLPVLGA
jgi:hypothetical protein